MATKIIHDYAQTSSISITGVWYDHHFSGDSSHGINVQYRSLQTIQALDLWTFEDWYTRDNCMDFSELRAWGG